MDTSAVINVNVQSNDTPQAQYKTVVLKPNMVDDVNTLTQAMLTVHGQNTKFVIKYDYTLGEDITVPANCILEFDGGSISGEYTITGQNTGIKAELVKIFNTDVTLAGTWNVLEAYPEWFGAVGDGVTDSAVAINKAVSTFLTTKCSGTFYISSPINISNKNFIVEGSIISAAGINALVVEGMRSNIEISGKIQSQNSSVTEQSTGAGIAIVGGGLIAHNNIKVNTIENYRSAINIAPTIPAGKNYGGVQYNVFTFQYIDNCYDGISLDLTFDGSVWINENRFCGGRISGTNGIKSYRRPGDTDTGFNGNLFENIGFEGIENPIIIDSLINSEFMNIRMSEDITGTYYIQMLGVCSNLKFDIHSYLDDSKIYAESSVNDIEIRSMFYNHYIADGIESATKRQFKFGGVSQVYNTNSEGFNPNNGSLSRTFKQVLDLDTISHIPEFIDITVENGVGLYIYVTNEDLFPDIKAKFHFTCLGNAYYVFSKTSGTFIISGEGKENVEIFWDSVKGEMQAFKTTSVRSVSTRPTTNLVKGESIFDASLNPARPIWYNGTAWVDATGTPV